MAKIDTVTPRYGYIDALRGWAITGVIVYHVGQVFPGPIWPLTDVARLGVEGVQLFFVVSAMTLMMSWHARDDGAVPFWLRRLFRIAPMFWIAIVFFVMLNEMNPAGWDIGPFDVLLAFLFLHGWSFPAMNHVVPFGWTVGAEMMFYAVFPLLARFITTLSRAILFVAAAWLISAEANSLFTEAAITWPGDDLRGYLTWWPFNALPGFATGCLVYHLLPLAPRSWAMAFCLRAAAACLMLFCIVHPMYQYSNWFHPLARPVIVAPSCALFILSLANRPAPLFVNGVTRFAGRVSYSAYLLHVLAVDQVVAYRHWIHQIPLASAVVFALACLAAMAVTFAASSVAYRRIERPAIELGTRLIRRWTSGKIWDSPEGSRRNGP